MMQSRFSFITASLLVREAINPLLNTLPTTFSKEITWGLSVSGVLRLECEEDWRGVLVVGLLVKNTRGEALFARVQADFQFIDDACWLILDEVFVFSIKLIDKEEDNWFSGWMWAKSNFLLFVNWARELFKICEFEVLNKVGMWDLFVIDKWEWLIWVNWGLIW